MNLFKKKSADNITESNKINNNIQNIIKTIEEYSDDQREIVKYFKTTLHAFTEDRSLESCLEALNLSMQLSNTREQLIETYRQYCILLESELKRIINNKKNN